MFAEADNKPDLVRNFARALKDLCDSYPALRIVPGTGKAGSLILKKDGANILEFNLSGSISVRKLNEAGESNFRKAFGPELGEYYQRKVGPLFRRGGLGSVAYFSCSKIHPGDRAERVLGILRDVLKKA